LIICSIRQGGRHVKGEMGDEKKKRRGEGEEVTRRGGAPGRVERSGGERCEGKEG